MFFHLILSIKMLMSLGVLQTIKTTSLSEFNIQTTGNYKYVFNSLDERMLHGETITKRLSAIIFHGNPLLCTSKLYVFSWRREWGGGILTFFFS